MGIAPKTKILTSDFQWRKAGDLEVGDELITIDPSGRYWDVTRLSHVAQVRGPAWRLDIEPEFSLEASADQKILTMSVEQAEENGILKVIMIKETGSTKH